MVHRQKARGGFTLIELLVVIAIIAILAAILFPVFARAKDAGKRAKCAGNEKQLLNGFIMYADDWGGRLPAVWSVDSWSTEWWKKTASPNWAKAVFPYVKNYHVYRCPTSIPHVIAGNPSDPRNSARAIHPTSYLYNGIATGYDPRTRRMYGKPLDLCRHPSKTCSLREMKWYIQMAQAFPDYTGAYTMYFGYKCHVYGSNYGFWDGHIKYLKKMAVPDDPNNPFWNFDDGVYVKNNPWDGNYDDADPY